MSADFFKHMLNIAAVQGVSMDSSNRLRKRSKKDLLLVLAGVVDALCKVVVENRICSEAELNELINKFIDDRKNEDMITVLASESLEDLFLEEKIKI